MITYNKAKKKENGQVMPYVYIFSNFSYGPGKEIPF